MIERRFKDKFAPQKKIPSVAGMYEKVNYTGRYDDRGRVILTPSGKTNMYEFIQSHADSVDINVLLAKYKNGDAEVLSRAQGVYADITDMPKTFADMLNKVMAAEDSFNALDVDTRALFNHSLTEFLATAGTKEWCEKMGVEFVEPKKKSSSKSSKQVKSESVPDSVPSEKTGEESAE